jgi:hypothetical protein
LTKNKGIKGLCIYKKGVYGLKNRVLGFLSLIIVGGFAIAYIMTGIINLGGAVFAKTLDEYVVNPEKGMYISGGIKMADGPIYIVTHTINGIPTGKEYYYSVYTDEGTVVYVRASKGFQKKFVDGFSSKPVVITGKIRAMDYDVNNALSDDAKAFQDNGYEVATTGDRLLYLDDVMIPQAIMRIVFMFMVAAPIVLMSVIGGNTPLQNMSGGRKAVTTILILVMMAGLVGLLHTVTFMF